MQKILLMTCAFMLLMLYPNTPGNSAMEWNNQQEKGSEMG